MARVQRLWTDLEIAAMPATLSLLRRMRSAAVTSEDSLFINFKRSINSLFGGNKQIYPPQEALEHAVELADAAGDFFAAKLSKTTQGKKEFEQWQDLLADAKRQYQLYGKMTSARTSLGEVIGFALIGRLRALHIDPDYILQWDLLQNNNLGVTSLGRLCQGDVGVITPLSGDYLLASTYRSYLQRTRDSSFPLHVAAQRRNLSTTILPLSLHDSLDNLSAVGIYVDTTQTGRTAQALYSALREILPEKTVHEPRFTKTKFTPNKKIERYWAQRS
ncbi:hypothetical protein J4210_02930 [Candidatus Woesearchaeota archaeon]|nr:hypothetical protein [Candidatus Woesearchaeota archaeon]